MKNEILEAIDYLDIDLDEINDPQELYEAIDYNGTMNEIIDGMIDIYYHDLREWAVKNWDYVERANEEGLGTDGKDYHKDIQCGQYVYFQEKAYNLMDGIYEEVKTEEV